MWEEFLTWKYILCGDYLPLHYSKLKKNKNNQNKKTRDNTHMPNSHGFKKYNEDETFEKSVIHFFLNA